MDRFGQGADRGDRADPQDQAAAKYAKRKGKDAKRLEPGPVEQMRMAWPCLEVLTGARTTDRGPTRLVNIDR